MKNSKMSNLMGIHTVGAELFHEDGRTDMTKLKVPFRNFAKRIQKFRAGVNFIRGWAKIVHK